jgi:hypothetical protein
MDLLKSPEPAGILAPASLGTSRFQQTGVTPSEVGHALALEPYLFPSSLVYLQQLSQQNHTVPAAAIADQVQHTCFGQLYLGGYGIGHYKNQIGEARCHINVVLNILLE